MDFCSQVIRRVEIPPSLPQVENLSKIYGTVILKDATAENRKIRVEGDLLWQGFFINEDGEEECLWEGAEFFQEELPFSNLRIREPFMMEPEVTDITASTTGENECEIVFSVRWWQDDSVYSEEEESFDEEIQEIEDNFRETMDVFAQTGEEDDLKPEDDEIIDVPAEVVSTTEAEKELNTTEEVKKKTIKASASEAREKQEEEEKILPEQESEGTNPSSFYCLRYYRAKEGDTMENIAQRFSLSLAKMRSINELDEVGSIQGRMVRVQ